MSKSFNERSSAQCVIALVAVPAFRNAPRRTGRKGPRAKCPQRRKAIPEAEVMDRQTTDPSQASSGSRYSSRLHLVLGIGGGGAVSAVAIGPVKRTYDILHRQAVYRFAAIDPARFGMTVCTRGIGAIGAFQRLSARRIVTPAECRVFGIGRLGTAIDPDGVDRRPIPSGSAQPDGLGLDEG